MADKILICFCAKCNSMYVLPPNSPKRCHKGWAMMILAEIPKDGAPKWFKNLQKPTKN